MVPRHRPLGKNAHLEPVHGVATRLRRWFDVRVHAWDGVPAASSEREPKARSASENPERSGGQE